MSIVVRPMQDTDALAWERLWTQYPTRFQALQLHLARRRTAGVPQHVWYAQDTQSGEMEGLLLRHNNTILLADRDGACATAFATLIDTLPNIVGVRGTLETITDIQALLQHYRPTDWEDSFYLRLNRLPQCPPETLAFARRATLDDLDKLTALYAKAGEMYRSRENVERKLRETRVFVVERREKIVSAALLNAEDEQGGLIGGVYTASDMRGRGYAMACTAALCRDLQLDGKTPLLFYENPVAGRVYHRLGFERIGHWAVLYLATIRERKS